MKRWRVGSAVFFSTLVLGIFSAWLFTVKITPTPANLDNPDIPKMVFEPSKEIADFVPEFKNVSIPDADQDIPFKLQLGFDGEFTLRKCELNSSKTNSRWLGLFKKGTSYSLEQTSLRVGRPESDDFGIWYPVKFRNSKTASFLFTDDGSLKLGSVKTLYERPQRKYVDNDEISQAESMEIGFNQQFAFRGINYVIRVAPGTDEVGRQVGVVVIERGEKHQVIYYCDLFGGKNMTIADLEWVGDLDGDGLLDLQISYFEQNGGGQNSILFLSSKSVDDSIVKAYALSLSRNPGC